MSTAHPEQAQYPTLLPSQPPLLQQDDEQPVDPVWQALPDFLRVCVYVVQFSVITDCLTGLD